MSNGTPPPDNYWKSREMVRDVFTFAQTLIIGVMGFWMAQNRNNHEQIGQVEVKQVEAADKTEKVKERLEEKLASDAKKIEEDIERQGIQLYSTWKYLQDAAEYSGLPKDINKAAEAKKVYEEYIRRHNGK